jgi:Protein of unknown function (DUF3306)
MSEEEFLSRWSRRKREAGRELWTAKEIAAPVEPSDARQTGPPQASSARPGEPEFDLSSLPPIDSITAATDLTAFLRQGVPQELRRAALRRAWMSDPAIRDFVGLAENAWDFNDPNAMPGFGPLDALAEHVQEFAAQLVGGGARRADSRANPSPAEKIPSAQSESRLAGESGELGALAVDRDTSREHAPTDEPPAAPAAAQLKIAQSSIDLEPHIRRRRHGGALPQ